MLQNSLRWSFNESMVKVDGRASHMPVCLACSRCTVVFGCASYCFRSTVCGQVLVEFVGPIASLRSAFPNGILCILAPCTAELPQKCVVSIHQGSRIQLE